MENKSYTVSEVTAAIKMLLEARFPQMTIEGEISNYRPSSAGHCYFTLKDKNAMIQAVIFRGDAARLKFRPRDGMKVTVTGRLTVYAGRGNYQIICSLMEEKGKGDILALLEERKRRLAAEGLFESRFKKELPPYPERIVVITSPTGAALQDILKVLARRNSSLNVRILPTAVQGDQAASKIVKLIELANRKNMGELIILARGGGSLEDLLPFSDELVVRAISDSFLPVVSGVGHEIDFSLADFAADIRGATPSAAAELVCQSSADTTLRIGECRDAMRANLNWRVSLMRQRLRPLSPPQVALNFRRSLEPLIMRVDDNKERLIRRIKGKLELIGHSLELKKKELEGASPLGIMERGYAHVSGPDGKTLYNGYDLKNEDLLKIRFAKDEIKARVEE